MQLLAVFRIGKKSNLPGCRRGERCYLRDDDRAIALKGSNKEVTAIIFENMSQRMGETVKSEMEYLHNIRVRDVEEAQQKIVAVIRRLEEEGEIVISKGGKDDMIV